jgi:hypothetical protein
MSGRENEMDFSGAVGRSVQARKLYNELEKLI